MFTKEEIENRLKKAQDELKDIERTNDKSRRLRWRELKKIIKHYKDHLNGERVRKTV
ncbi:MAG: hypothetical protein II670_00970 [Alphaproteobacteria bacterium]|nr:hypothetical protein [Alphaproteobacteria bacterium]